MDYKFNKIAGGKVCFTFTLSHDERVKFDSQAFKRLTKDIEINGFRKGMAPEHLLRSRISSEELIKEIVKQAIAEYYLPCVKQEQVEVIDTPELSIKSNEPLQFDLTVSVLPTVVLGNWQQISVEQKPVVVNDVEIEDLIKQICDSRASEVTVARSAQLGDRVEIDFNITLNNVVIEGGSAKNYSLILGQGKLIPGFEQAVVGMKVAESKDFTVTFPADYRQDLAGRQAQAQVKLNNVYERTIPELTDEFVKNIGKFTSVVDLRAKLKENLTAEHGLNEDKRVEKQMIGELIKIATIDEIPNILLEQETAKMIHELKHSVESRGLEWTEYTKNLNISESSLRQEFKTSALERVKAALILRHFASVESLEASDEEAQAEVDKTLSYYQSDERAVAQFKSEDYKDYMRSVLTNQKILAWLKQKLVKQSGF